MDYRQYDSAIGRFLGVDLLSELTPSETPNHFGHNNPVFFSDPSGMEARTGLGYLNGEIIGSDGMTNSQWVASLRPSDSPMAQWSAGEKDRIARQHNAPLTGSKFGGRGKELFRIYTEDENHYYADILG